MRSRSLAVTKGAAAGSVLPKLTVVPAPGSDAMSKRSIRRRTPTMPRPMPVRLA